MPAELSSYRSLDVGKRYRVLKAYCNAKPGDLLDCTSITHGHDDDCHVIAFSKAGVEGNYLSLVTNYEEDVKFIHNAAQYLRDMGDTPESTTEAETKRGGPPPKQDVPYTLQIAGHSNYQDPRSPIPIGKFDSYVDAVQIARQIVNNSLAELGKKGMTADELYESYMLYGDDPYIAPNDGNPFFSAQSYAREQCAAICKKH